MRIVYEYLLFAVMLGVLIHDIQVSRWTEAGVFLLFMFLSAKDVAIEYRRIHG